ncbi:hypothetical protein ABBQ38_005027 [Trebouxia sp. C0009 RCD-2024]
MGQHCAVLKVPELRRIVEQRSVWRWTVITDFLWALVGAWVFFWQTLITPDAKQSSQSKRPPPKDRDGKGRGPTGSRVTGMSSLQDNSNAAVGGGGC